MANEILIQNSKRVIYHEFLSPRIFKYWSKYRKIVFISLAGFVMSTTMLMGDAEESHAKESHEETCMGMGAGDHITVSDEKSIMAVVTYVRPNEALLRYLLEDCVMRYLNWQWVIRNISNEVEKPKHEFTLSDFDFMLEVRSSSAPNLTIKTKYESRSSTTSSAMLSSKSKSSTRLGKPKKIVVGKLRKHILIKAKYADLPEKRKQLMPNDQAAKIVEDFEKPITKLYNDICGDKTLSAKEKKKQITKLKKSEPFVNKVIKSQEKFKEKVEKKPKPKKTIGFWKKRLNGALDSTEEEKKKMKKIQEIIEKHPGIYRCVKISREVKDELLQEKQYCQKVSIDEYEKNKLNFTAKAQRDQLVHVLESKTMTNIEKTKFTRQFAKVYPHVYREICGTLPSSTELSSPLKKRKFGFSFRFLNLFKKSSETSNHELATDLVDSESS